MSAKDIGTLDRSVDRKFGEDDDTIEPLKSNSGRRTSLQLCHERKQRVCGCFREYSASTSIHGVQYLGELDRPVWERVFWIVVFIISICICSHMIYKLWRKWNDTPVIVSFDERETEIWKIPFPAITICPQAKSNPSVFKFENVVNKSLTDLTESEIRTGKALLNVCTLLKLLDYPMDLSDSEMEVDIIKELKANFPSGEPVLTFKGDKMNMSLVITEEGVCHNFNSISLKDLYTDDCDIPLSTNDTPETHWNREDGYSDGAGMNAYPFRVFGPGIKLGVDIFLLGDKSESDKLCNIPPDGYKVLIHAPDNVPIVGEKFFSVPKAHHVIAAIKPNMMWTSDELKTYSSDKRQCFFHSERSLKYFKAYTEINCYLECLTDYTLDRCDCVKFSMPRFNGTRICQSEPQSDCAVQAEHKFLTAEIEYEYAPETNSMNIKEFCNCLPPCTTVMYNIETSQTELDVTSVSKILDYSKESENLTISRLTVFFKEGSFLTSKRSELYGMSEFVANCGGLLGLFMGFSALSLVEIFYFSIIREITNYARRRRQNWF